VKFLNFFGSKKLAAIVGGVLATLLTPVLNAKLNLNMDSVEVAQTMGSVLALVLTYVAAQWHIDIKTEGSTTLAKSIGYAAGPQAPGPLPAKVTAALSIALMFLPDGEAKDKVKEALVDLTGPSPVTSGGSLPPAK
jgi:hypothetical protein